MRRRNRPRHLRRRSPRLRRRSPRLRRRSLRCRSLQDKPADPSTEIRRRQWLLAILMAKFIVAAYTLWRS